MGKKYMDTKVGTLEESILGVWQDTVDDIEEKYTDAQRAAREKSRGSDGRAGGYGGQAAEPLGEQGVCSWWNSQSSGSSHQQAVHAEGFTSVQ